jgi:hypothetical protein
VFARGQSSSKPLAAQKDTQNVSSDAAPGGHASEEGRASFLLSSAQEQPTAMSSAGDVQKQEPLEDNTTSHSDDQTGTRARVTETVLSGATLSGGTRAGKDSANVISEQSARAQSLRSDERDESHPPLAAHGGHPQGLSTLIDKHTEVLAVRVNAEELGTKSKSRKHALRELETQYMDNLERFVENESVERLANLKHDLKQLQSVRADVLALEAEYEVEATRLVQLEAELRNLEIRMYRLLENSSADSTRLPNEGTLDKNRPQQELDESYLDEWDNVVEHPPEIQAYLSQQGDVNLLRERLMDKDTEYFQVSEEKVLREELGLEPEVDAEGFLASFEAEREVLATQLREAEMVLANLEANLRESENLHIRGNPFADIGEPPDGPSREHSLFGKDDYYDEQTLDEEALKRLGLASEEVLAAAAALFPATKASQLVYADVGSDSTGMGVDKASYINSWQLHRLRQSTREVARLIYEQEQIGVQLSPEHLEAKVLETWMHDGTMHSFDFPRFENYTHELSMAAHSGASHHSRPVSNPPLQAWQTTEHLRHRRLSTGHAETTR